MLLKISDGNGGWHIFDNVQYAHLLMSKSHVSNVQQLDKISEGEIKAVSLIYKGCFENGRSIDVGVIEFKRNDKDCRALVTGSIYILNEKGDTIEKIYVSSNRKAGQ